MMFYKPLVSLFMLFAATSGAAASVTPVRRGNGYGSPEASVIPVRRGIGYGSPEASVVPVRRGIGYGPPAAIAPSNCNVSQQCCTTVTTDSNGLLSGQGCSPLDLIGGNTCTGTPVCCKDIAQNGLVNIACVPIDVNL